jgi:hypothetical protein
MWYLLHIFVFAAGAFAYHALFRGGSSGFQAELEASPMVKVDRVRSRSFCLFSIHFMQCMQHGSSACMRVAVCCDEALAIALAC